MIYSILGLFFISLIGYFLRTYAKYKQILSNESYLYGKKKDLDRPYFYQKIVYYDVKELPVLPLKRFKNFYFINPKGWELKEGVAYKGNHRNYSGAIVFKPFLNFIEYENFRKKIERDCEKGCINKTQKEILTNTLKDIQKDIDETVEKVNKELKKSVELTNQVKANLREKG